MKICCRLLLSFLFLVNVTSPGYAQEVTDNSDNSSVNSNDSSNASTGYIGASTTDGSTAIQGQLIFAHADDFKGKKDYEFYFLKDKANKFYRVKFKNRCGRHFPEGQHVNLHGSRNGQVIEVGDDTPNSVEDLDHRPAQKLWACKPSLSDQVESDDDSDGAEKSSGNTLSSPVAAIASAVVSGIGAAATKFPLTSVPVLNSNPGASATLYLNFIGAPSMTWLSYTPPATPAYDQDGDPTTFTSAELTSIKQIWQAVSELYSPFNINVTTVAPATLVHGQNMEIIVGGSGAWVGSPAGGVSYIGAFASTFLPNISFVFPGELANGTPKYTADAIAHESGHEFGLYHQATWSGTTLVADYSTGTAADGPIMGDPYGDTRATWFDGASDISSTTIQDDMAVIAGTANSFGYRNNLGIGATLSTATPLAVSGNALSYSNTFNPSSNLSFSGIITKTPQVDYYSFATGTGTISLSVQQFLIPSVFYGMLSLKILLYTSDGKLVTLGGSGLTESINATVSAGTYILAVSSDGSYGDVGQYIVTGTIPSTYAITATASGGGTISLSSQNVVSGSSTTVTMTPSPGYILSALSVGGTNVTTLPTELNGVYTYTFTPTASEVVAATFIAVPQYNITVTQSTGGIISPSTTAVNSGSSQTFQITPTSGYTLLSLLVDNVAQNISSLPYNSSTNTYSYTFSNVTAPHIILAQFNKIPVVSAMTNQNIALGTTANLSATVTDDGLPNPPGAMTYQWQQLSGTGTVIFGSPNSLSTTATFPAPDSYMLSFRANDNNASGFNTVVVTVNPSNVAPVVSAGSAQTITLPATASLSGTATDVTAGTLTNTWTYTSVPAGGTVTFSPSASSLTPTATFSQAGTYTFTLTSENASTLQTGSNSVTVTVNPANVAPVVSAGSAQTITLPATASLSGTATDVTAGTLTEAWSMSSFTGTGAGTVTFDDPNVLDPVATFTLPGKYVLTLTVENTATSQSTAANVTVTVNPANVAPVVGAGSAQTITLPATASLSGIATDVTAGALTNTWTYSGPAGGTVTFSPSASSLTPTATFSQAGIYTFTLTSENIVTLQTGSNTVTVTVNPANVAPVVSAGSTQTITLPVTASLSGTATDVTAGTLTNTWTYTAVPTGGTVTFSPSATSLNPTATFSQAGTYTFTLTSENTTTLQTGNNTVTVTVNPANVAPVVSAGTAQTITLPATATLSGIATDVTAGSLTSTWSMASFTGTGAGTVSFDDPNDLNVTATFTLPGKYILTLTTKNTVTSQSTSATVTVTVNPANVAPVVSAGTAQTITLPATASLSGTATDVTAGTLTETWSMASFTGTGAGTVTFDDSNVLDPVATFTLPGKYVLTLTVENTVTSQSTTANVTVTVNTANVAPVVSAGNTQTITLPATASLTGTATDVTTGTLTNTWTYTSVPTGGTVTFNPSATSLHPTVTFSQAGTYTFTLTSENTTTLQTGNNTVTVTVNPANVAPVVSAGNAQTITLPATASLGGTATDVTAGTLTNTWTYTAVPTGGTVTFTPSASSLTPTATFSQAGTYTFTLTTENTTTLQTGSNTVTVTVNQANVAPVVSAGTAQTITLPATASLSGTATDVTAGTLTEVWSMSSFTGTGAGTVTFDDSNVLDPVATFTLPGKYVLTLTVENTATSQSTTANVTVTVNPANVAPVVSAGSAQTITLPATASLSGTATDVTAGTLSNTWTYTAVPAGGTVTFSPSASSLNPTVTFSQAGTYTFTLTTENTTTLQTGSNTVTVTVNPANVAPIVNAGTAQTITLPATASLSGTATDVTAGTLTETWSMASFTGTGAGTVTFSPSATSLNPTATFSQAGTYTLTLTSENTTTLQTGNNTVTVTVNPANVAPVVSAGTAQTITLPATASLSGTATDVTAGTLTNTWTYTAVPTGGTVTFSPSASSLTPTATFSQAGTYTFTLTTENTSTLQTSSNTVTVTANPANIAPSITTQPVNRSANVGTTATFSVTASGSPAPTYQWQKNGNAISGATGSSYTTPTTVIGDDQSTYTVVVSNKAGNVTSNAATLTLLYALNVTAAHGGVNRSSSFYAAGASVTLTPFASSGFQFSSWSGDLTGSANPAIFPMLNRTMNITANFIVATAPGITTQPADQTVNVGQSATFNVVASGSAPLTYVWQKNGAAISGATSASYTTPAATTADDQSKFTVVVTNTVGTITSRAADLSVTVAPVITTQPSNQTVNVGQTATFGVVASGTAPLTYQWQMNGANIFGANSATYQVSNATAAESGTTYTVQVSNAAGNANSNPATLTVVVIPPTITTQPASQIVNAGTAATFNVVASGSVPMTYQWQKNGAAISGATNASYTTPATTSADDQSKFTVVVANSANAVTSSAAVLTVDVAPTITAQPLNQTVNVGDTATFNVTASGSGTLSYQWQKNGVNINAATGASYTTPATVAADDQSTFTVMVTNVVSSVTSSIAVLTVNAAPSITKQPVNQTVNSGSTATFSVVVTGNPLPSYQWQKNNVDISGATSASYTTPVTTTADDQSKFTVLVTNSVSSITSSAAVLTVDTAPVIITQPLDQIVNAGATAAFNVVATGNPTPTYQWQKNGANISGATASSYTTPVTVAADDQSKFTVVVTNSINPVTSAAAVLTVNFAPNITTQPLNQTVNAGTTATFSVIVSGSAPMSYQWQKNGTAISGATSSSYTTPVTTSADDQSKFTVIVANSINSVTSSAAVLTVDVAPTITAQPLSQTVNAGSIATFNVTATGSGTLSYQWKKNGVNINAATDSSYTTPATIAADDQSTFTVVVTDVVSSVTSSIAVLTVNAAPSITKQPDNQTVNVGSTATFNVIATGNPLPTYQWQKNGVNISGATSAFYTTPATTTTDDQSKFTVTVSNSVNSVTSAAAVLTVDIAPAITTQPLDQTVNAGATAAFNVVATGNPIPTYQWQKNGANISGATAASYTTPATTAADDQSKFTVIVTNSLNPVTSAAAVLTVHFVPSITTQPSNQTVNAGSTATFNVTTTGNPLPTYQWQKNGADISGANSASYATPATITSDDQSKFTVTVTNSIGSVTSSAGVLTVDIAPSITAQPVDQAVNAGAVATFSVVATGNPMPAYQWQKNGVNISGATGTSYTTPATIAADDQSKFTVIVTNSVNSITSAAAVLTVNVAPSITAQPANQTVNLGATATFSVTASGSGTLSYQWQKNGADISGAMGASYTTPATLGFDDQSKFKVVVTNFVGSVTSTGAVLTVDVAPSITAQPLDQTVNAGSTATFSVTATGNPLPTYQWQKNGANISGATSASYTTPTTAAADDQTKFTVIVTNTVSSVTSTAGVLTVDFVPSITTQPLSQTVNTGATATFSATSTGNPMPTYQWQKNGADISGANSASYTTPATIASDDQSKFTVTVTNSVGSATSNTGLLTVDVAPAITTEPSNQTVDSGATAVFSVAATGNPAPTYQWQKNGVNIVGATSASYITPVTTVADDQSKFTVTVTNSVSSVTSDPVNLTVIVIPPGITNQPINQTVDVGQSASFSVIVSGSAPLTYQWQVNGVSIPGANSSTYQTSNTAITDNGAVYTAQVSNSAGTITSSPVTLTVVVVPPGITHQPANQTVGIGQSATFSVTASGSTPLTYQWQINGANIQGATGSSYQTPIRALTDTGTIYTVQVSNSAGTVTSNPATLTVIANLPTITVQPANQVVVAGQPAAFSVTASSSVSMSYQWSKNGVPISGATGPTYQTPSTVFADNGGIYTVQVSNMAGSVPSSQATLIVENMVSEVVAATGTTNIGNQGSNSANINSFTMPSSEMLQTKSSASDDFSDATDPFSSPTDDNDNPTGFIGSTSDASTGNTKPASVSASTAASGTSTTSSTTGSSVSTDSSNQTGIISPVSSATLTASGSSTASSNAASSGKAASTTNTTSATSTTVPAASKS